MINQDDTRGHYDRETIIAYVERELHPDDSDDLEKHIKDCSDCNEVWRGYVNLVKFRGNLDPEDRGDFVEDILDEIGRGNLGISD